VHGDGGGGLGRSPEFWWLMNREEKWWWERNVTLGTKGGLCTNALGLRVPG